MPNLIRKINKLMYASAVTTLLAILTLRPPVATRAQRAKESPARVAEIQARPTRNGTVVTISADVPLHRAQTWQDGEGIHVAVPYAGGSTVKRVPRGVKVRQLGRSLEIVVPVKPGANVTVEPHFNRLNLVVNGDLDTTQSGPDEEKSTPTPRKRKSERGEASAATAVAGSRPPRERQATTASAPVAPLLANTPERTAINTGAPLSAVAATAPNTTSNVVPNTANSPVPNTPAGPATGKTTLLVPPDEDTLVTANTSATATSSPAAPPATNQPHVAPGEGILSKIFSATGVSILLLLGLISLLVIRRRQRSAPGVKVAAEAKGASEEASTQANASASTSATETPVIAQAERRKGERRKNSRRKTEPPANQPKVNAAPAQAAERQSQQQQQEQSLEVVRPSAQAPAALFGAYRVDQEVGKLILGQPHRIDVLSSRAPDDRRAIETSLIKAMNSPDLDEDGRGRARQALEDYGFVARQSAALLLAPDSYERASAARTLGEVGAAAALPFLLESLYDAEAIVRTQAVESLGALRIPSAIGALLDIARRHPEMPAALLSRVLSACSVECVPVDGVYMPEAQITGSSALTQFTGEITQVEPAARVEDLPEWLEDEKLTDALERLESADVEARLAAARLLAQFQVQRSVQALSAMATGDPESSVRAVAVGSLAVIGHESVFAPILIAFADEAREVRAAAARSLSRLNFDRADAFVRLLDTADLGTLTNVARACIKAGMATQAIDRLASEDRRQAYESFSLLSVLARSQQTGPILEAIERHSDLNVRMTAIRLLGLTGQPEVAQQFRQLAVSDGVPEKIRTALLEVVYKIDQAQPAYTK